MCISSAMDLFCVTEIFIFFVDIWHHVYLQHKIQAHSGSEILLPDPCDGGVSPWCGLAACCPQPPTGHQTHHYSDQVVSVGYYFQCLQLHLNLCIYCGSDSNMKKKNPIKPNHFAYCLWFSCYKDLCSVGIVCNSATKHKVHISLFKAKLLLPKMKYNALIMPANER